VSPLSGSDLAAFVVAFDCASVHAAADALRLTASAVTKRVQSLERRLGVELFERGRFGLRPTEVARLLYPEARQALAALERAELVVAETGSRKVLSLAASHTTGEFLLPGWLAAFRMVEPNVVAKVAVVNSATVTADLLAGRGDLGFVEGHDPLDSFVTIDAHRDLIVTVVGRGHRWARKRTLRAVDLRSEPYYTREAGSGTRAVAEAALHAAGVDLVPTLEVASIQSLKRALNAGGFSLLSGLAIETERAAGSLVGIPLSDVDLTRILRAIRPARRRPTATAATFWRWLESRPRPAG